jgi:hypothetical protein
MSLTAISVLLPDVRRQLFDCVLDRVDIPIVLRLAGYDSPDRRGFMKCPLHVEHSPSFHVVNSGRGFRCFGCGRKGGILDLVVALGVAQDHASAARWLEMVL